jgi:hypothetical protein
MDDQGDLAPRRVFSIVGGKFSRSSMTVFLMDLGEFPSNTETTLRRQEREIGKTGPQAMRRFKIDSRHSKA